MIIFENIVKTYGNLSALDGVNFSVDQGEFVSLVGPSGSGKSTLIKLLICEERPTKGKIFIAGFEVTSLSPDQIPFYRRHVGVVFQDYKLLPDKNVFENVSYAMEVSGRSRLEIRSQVPKILDLVGLFEKKDNYPVELSGGERQRVAIARSLVHQPKLIAADEPTGNLDPVNTWEIIQLLLKINQQGTTVLLATHNKEVVDSLQKRVITLNNGRIVRDQMRGKYVI